MKNILHPERSGLERFSDISGTQLLGVQNPPSTPKVCIQMTWYTRSTELKKVHTEGHVRSDGVFIQIGQCLIRSPGQSNLITVELSTCSCVQYDGIKLYDT